MPAAAGQRAAAVERIPLEHGWEAVSVSPGGADHLLEGLEDRMVPFRAPGTAGGALRDAGAWQPGSGRDLDAEDWWFRCRFEQAAPEPGTETVLRLDGLATLADVWLNGEHVLSSENMHAEWTVPATGLRAGTNELVIGVRALAPALAGRRPRPRWRTRLVETQALRWFRTALAGRIPAFAPGPAPVGPWRPVSLERRRWVAVDRLQLRTALDGDEGVLDVRAHWRELGGFRARAAAIRLHGPTGTASAPLETAPDGGSVEVSGRLRIENAALWWPHTHGTPELYDAEIVVEDGGDAVVAATTRVGFRRLEAAGGRGLALSVNGVPVFCRGGTLLPDGVTLDHPRARLHAVLSACRDAGMNMVRLSGVGTYASEELLGLCDELGLLVWQDFAFANLDYPVDDEAFRDGVEEEARGFLARAGAHPCLTVLCGNSEIEQQVAMLGLDPALGRGELFDGLLPRLVDEERVDAPYVRSTPSGGALPFRPGAGVAHYFGVGAYRRPLEDARRADVPFAAECLAFANVPADETIEELAPGGAARLVHHPGWKAGVPRDTGAGWDFEDVRDHYLRELFGIDPLELRAADPERYLAVSRVTSGEVMAAVLGEWRRARSGCAGALVWTLTDPLPGAGWGVFDAHGRPKAPYWFLRRALQPVAVWLTDEGTNGIAVHVANDTGDARAHELAVELVRADGHAVAAGTAPLELPAHTTVELDAETVLGRFADASWAYRFGPPAHDAVVATLRDGEAVVSRAVHFPAGAPVALRPSESIGIEAAVERAGGGVVLARLRPDRLAYAVAVASPGHVPDDDFATLPAGVTTTLAFRPLGDHPWQGATLRPLNSHTASVIPA
jgi:beta-mannosidase